jgi:hypothetical protein
LNSSQGAADDASGKMPQRVEETLITPFSDLNLVRTEIPLVLHEARKQPYALPTDHSCAGLVLQVQALDGALRTDLDVVTVDEQGNIEKGVDLLGDVTLSALRGTFEGLIPFRSWVRRLSGADRYSKEVAESIAAGSIRRAYLKGMGQAKDCKPPAAPLKPVIKPKAPASTATPE